MVPYNLEGSTVECHHYLENGGGTGKEFPIELVNNKGNTKWYTT